MTELVSTNIEDIHPLLIEREMKGQDAELSQVMSALSDSNFFDKKAHSSWEPGAVQPTVDGLPLVQKNRVCWEARIKEDTKTIITDHRRQGNL